MHAGAGTVLRHSFKPMRHRTTPWGQVFDQRRLQQLYQRNNQAALRDQGADRPFQQVRPGVRQLPFKVRFEGQYIPPGCQVAVQQAHLLVRQDLGLDPDKSVLCQPFDKAVSIKCHRFTHGVIIRCISPECDAMCRFWIENAVPVTRIVVTYEAWIFQVPVNR